MDKVSIIVPCYNEERTIPIFWAKARKIIEEMKFVKFELLFIDDGSKDNTFKLIKQLSNIDKRVKYITFSRNFGKEAAIYAGLKNVSGNYIALMDADLQDPPELLKNMYNEIKKEEVDCVATRRINRKGEPKIRSFFSWSFYKFINKISKTEFVDGARDFRMMSKRMKDEILKVSEYNRFSKGIFSWVGFETKWIQYENRERIAGKTKWSFWGLIKYSQEAIINFSDFLLKIPYFLGIIFLIISIVSYVIKTERLLSIIFINNFFLLWTIGIMGEYVRRVYLETKKRPLYIVKEKN